MYGENSKALCSASTLRKNGITQAWDVEELAEVGRNVRACPYYASVSMDNYLRLSLLRLCKYGQLLTLVPTTPL